jgi:hypothetical protein
MAILSENGNGIHRASTEVSMGKMFVIYDAIVKTMINTWYPEKVCDKLANLKKNDNGIE